MRRRTLKDIEASLPFTPHSACLYILQIIAGHSGLPESSAPSTYPGLRRVSHRLDLVLDVAIAAAVLWRWKGLDKDARESSPPRHLTARPSGDRCQHGAVQRRARMDHDGAQRHRYSFDYYGKDREQDTD